MSDAKALVQEFCDRMVQRDAEALRPTYQVVALGLPDQGGQVRTFRFLEFERVKKQVASKSNMASERMIIGRVLDELENQQGPQEPQEIPSDSFL